MQTRSKIKAFRIYQCPKCGNEGWAMDDILKVKCRKCGTIVETQEQDTETKSYLEKANQ